MGWRVKYAHANPNIPSNNATATSHASRSRFRKDDAPTFSTTAGKADISNREPDGDDKASRAKPRSLAV